MTKTILLQSLVGSRAHGLHNENSDYDYRGVHLLPTSEILALNYKYSPSSFLEGQTDETSYEVGHFLMLCTKANPSVLEVLLSEDVKVETPWANEMRELLPYMYNPKDALNAFAGYSKNQQKKLLEDHLGRRLKFGVAYVRTAYNLVQLFKTGTFSLHVNNLQHKAILLAIKAGQYSDGEIIDIAETYINEAKELLPSVENKQDLSKVNNLLIEIRKAHW